MRRVPVSLVVTYKQCRIYIMTDQNNDMSPIEQGIELRYLRRDLNDLKATMKEGFNGVNVQLKIFSEGYMKRDDILKTMAEFQAQIDRKVDREDFKPYKDGINRLIWIVISAVVLALLALIGLS